MERHHIFGGSLRRASELYGYVVPLRPDLHPNGVFAGKHAKEIDVYLKQAAQRDFEKRHGSRERFREVFKKSYL